MGRETFQYGDDACPFKTQISCPIPIRQCETCGFEYTDWVSEQIREYAVHAYLYSIGQGRAKEWSPDWKKPKG